MHNTAPLHRARPTPLTVHTRRIPTNPAPKPTPTPTAADYTDYTDYTDYDGYDGSEGPTNSFQRGLRIRIIATPWKHTTHDTPEPIGIAYNGRRVRIHPIYTSDGDLDRWRWETDIATAPGRWATTAATPAGEVRDTAVNVSRMVRILAGFLRGRTYSDMTGARLNSYRRLLGVNQFELSALVNIPVGSLRSMEAGPSPIPYGVELRLRQLLAEHDALVQDMAASTGPVVLHPGKVCESPSDRPLAWFAAAAGRALSTNPDLEVVHADTAPQRIHAIADGMGADPEDIN